LSKLESFGSTACVKLRLSVVKSPDISPLRGVACARLAPGFLPLRRCRSPESGNGGERSNGFLGEGPIKQQEITAGAGA
jgi:hypothetical protein